MRAEHEAREHGEDQHSPRVVVDLTDVDVLGEALDPAEAPLPLLLPGGGGEDVVDLLAPLGGILLGRKGDELAETRDQRLVAAEVPEEPDREEHEPDHEQHEEGKQDPRLHQLIAERG